MSREQTQKNKMGVKLDFKNPIRLGIFYCGLYEDTGSISVLGIYRKVAANFSCLGNACFMGNCCF